MELVDKFSCESGQTLKVSCNHMELPLSPCIAHLTDAHSIL